MSCCSTLEQFLPVALETVLVGFRVGLLAADTRDQIVVDKTNLAPWRVRVETGKPEVVLSQLEELCTQKVRSSQDLRRCQLNLRTAFADMVKAIRLLRVG